MVTVIQASPTIQRFAPASCIGRIPVTSPLFILLHINEDCYLIKRLIGGLDKGLKEGLQNKRRMNSFRGTPCLLESVDAAPSVPVHVRLGRYAGGGSQGSQSPPPPTGEDRVPAQPQVLEGPCPEGHTRKQSTFVLKMQRTITLPSELRRMA